MNLVIKLNLKNIKSMLWPVLLIFSCRLFELLNIKMAFLTYVALVIYLIFSLKKIIIPNIRGMRLYLFVLFYSTVVGLSQYNVRNVIRDLYYILPTIVLMVLGYYLFMFYGEKASLVKTLIIVGSIISTYVVFRFFTNISSYDELSGFKNNFGICSAEVLFIFLILFFYVFILKEKLFNKIFEFYSFVIMLLQIILSMQRNIWISLILGIISIIVVMMTIKKYRKRMIQLLMKTIIITVIIYFAAVLILPESVTEEMVDKISQSSVEINSNQEYDDVDDAMANWRGYEIHAAQKQWQQSNVFVELFGAGMGKGVHLDLVPYTWDSITKDGNIPLLHNGYYTILTKAGILGVIALIWFMLGNVVTGWDILKKKDYMIADGCILIAISAVYLLQTYVATGPVTQAVNITWPLLIGWICARYYRGKKEENCF